MFRRKLKYNLIMFLRLRGAPAKLSLGFAIGAVVNFYPTFGFGIPLAGIVAGIMTASIPAGLLGDVIFKPLFPVFFYLNLVTGYFIWSSESVDIDHVWRSLMHPGLSSLAEVSKVFFTGAVINSVILGFFLYLLMYPVVKKYRLLMLKWLVGRTRK